MFHCAYPGCVYDECMACHAALSDEEEDGEDGVEAPVTLTFGDQAGV